MLFPEGSGLSANNGVGQVASSLSQEGLTQVAADGRVTPRLAESWRWSDDGLELIVTLSPNILMHDRRRLDAERAAVILRSLIAEKDNIQYYPGVADVAAVTSDGERILRFKLRRHAAWLPEDLSMTLSVGENPRIGTGPYRVVGRDDHSRVLERFDEYYRGQPTIKRVEVRSSETLRIAWASLLRGDVDLVTDLPPDSVELIKNDNNVKIMSFARNYQYLIGYSGRSGKFSDPRVRRALNMAINRDSIVDGILKGNGLPGIGPLWPKHWAYDPSVPGYPFDPERAIALLQASGLEIQASRDGSLAPSRLRFTCLVPARFIIYEQIALEVQRQLSRIGVDIQFDVQPVDLYEKRLNSGDFEAVLVDLVGGPSLSRSSVMWRSPKRAESVPIFAYENPVTEALFESIRVTSNESATRIHVRQLQQAFLDNPPAIFLAWNERARAFRGDFNVAVEPGADPLPTLWRWGADRTDRREDRMAGR